MRAGRTLGPVAAALVAALLAAAVLVESAPAGAAPPERPLAVTAALAPLAAGFGDPVTASVRVLVDPERVDPGSLRLRTEFAPWREERQLRRRERAGLVEVTFLLRLTCHSIPCTSEQRQWQYEFPEARLRYLEGGVERRESIPWPPLQVSTRLPRGYEPPDDGSLDAVPVWRAAVAVPEPTYRAEPRLLQAALVGVALLSFAGTLAVGAVLLRRRAPKEVPPLERALAQLARARTPAERRAALEAVAVELHPALAAAARELAWSEQAPTEPAARELSDRAREVTP